MIGLPHRFSPSTSVEQRLTSSVYASPQNASQPRKKVNTSKVSEYLATFKFSKSQQGFRGVFCFENRDFSATNYNFPPRITTFHSSAAFSHNSVRRLPFQRSAKHRTNIFANILKVSEVNFNICEVTIWIL